MKQTPQVFCLNNPRPLAVKTADGYTATEHHTLSSAAARIGAPKTSVHRWIQSGDLPAKITKTGHYAFQSNHLDQLALRIRLARHQKQQAADAQTALSAIVSDPAAASDEDLVGAYIKSTGETATRIWSEVSQRYQKNPYMVGKAIDAAIHRNQQEARTAPKFANVWNKATGRTERVKVR